MSPRTTPGPFSAAGWQAEPLVRGFCECVPPPSPFQHQSHLRKLIIAPMIYCQYQICVMVFQCSYQHGVPDKYQNVATRLEGLLARDVNRAWESATTRRIAKKRGILLSSCFFKVHFYHREFRLKQTLPGVLIPSART